MNRLAEMGFIVAALVAGILVGYLLASLTALPTHISACPSTSYITTSSSPGFTGGFIPTGGPTGSGYDNNTYGSAFEMPTTVVSSNPWGGYTGNFSLLNAIAIRYAVVTIVMWFYYPQNGMGTLRPVARLITLGRACHQGPEKSRTRPVLPSGRNACRTAREASRGRSPP